MEGYWLSHDDHKVILALILMSRLEQMGDYETHMFSLLRVMSSFHVWGSWEKSEGRITAGIRSREPVSWQARPFLGSFLSRDCPGGQGCAADGRWFLYTLITEKQEKIYESTAILWRYLKGADGAIRERQDFPGLPSPLLFSQCVLDVLVRFMEGFYEFFGQEAFGIQQSGKDS